MSKVLKKEKTSWTSYNLASLYWRMKGDPFESIECLRRALHFGINRESQSVSLVHLGNVLHQSLRSEDAATVLEMAVDNDPLSPVAHYTVGNVYVSISPHPAQLLTLFLSLSAGRVDDVQQVGAEF